MDFESSKKASIAWEKAVANADRPDLRGPGQHYLATKTSKHGCKLCIEIGQRR
jgi:hypothetical protein